GRAAGRYLERRGAGRGPSRRGVDRRRLHRHGLRRRRREVLIRTVLGRAARRLVRERSELTWTLCTSNTRSSRPFAPTEATRIRTNAAARCWAARVTSP